MNPGERLPDVAQARAQPHMDVQNVPVVYDECGKIRYPSRLVDATLGPWRLGSLVVGPIHLGFRRTMWYMMLLLYPAYMAYVHVWRTPPKYIVGKKCVVGWRIPDEYFLKAARYGLGFSLICGTLFYRNFCRWEPRGAENELRAPLSWEQI